MRKHSLKRNLLIATLITVFLLAGSIVTLALENSFVQETALRNELITAEAEKTAYEIETGLNEIFSNIHSFALVDSIRNTDYTEEELEAHQDVIDKCLTFSSIVQAFPEKYENLAFYDKYGNVRIPTGVVKCLGAKVDDISNNVNQFHI